MKYGDRSWKLRCCSTMFLPWRSHNDYEHISRGIITNKLNRSLPNPYLFPHFFRLHLWFLSQALQKIPSTLTWGLENPLSRSKTILNRLLRTTMTWVMRNSLFEDESALQLSMTGRAELIGVLWDSVEIVDQQVTERGGAVKVWHMTQRQGFGIPTNLERFDLEWGQCYDFPSLLFLHIYSYFSCWHAWIACHFMLTDAAPWWLRSSTCSIAALAEKTISCTLKFPTPTKLVPQWCCLDHLTVPNKHHQTTHE